MAFQPVRSGIAVVVLLVVLLAGCSDSDQSGSPAPREPASPPTGPAKPAAPVQPTPPQGPVALPLLVDFEMHGCTGLSVAQPTNRSDVQALLPSGFQAEALPDPVTGAPSEFAALVIDIFQCGNFTIPTAALPNVWYGHVYTFVEYPESVPGAEDHGGLHEYLFRVLAGNDTLAILWPAAGYDTHAGAAQADFRGPLPSAGAPGVVAPVSASLGDYRFQASMLGAPDDQGEQRFSRYTKQADNATLIWTGFQNLPVTHTGFAEVTVAGDDPFAGLGAINGGRLSGPGVIVDGGTFTAQQLVRVLPAQ